MSDRLRHLLRLAREASRPEPHQLHRLHDRLREVPQDDADVQSLLAGVGAPTPTEVARLHARLAGQGVPSRGPALAPRLALAAVVVLSVGGAWWWTSVPPTAPALAVRLEGASAAPVATTDLVQLAWTGEGDVGGTERSPRIDWRQGRLELDVVPGAGVDLVVHTAEAEVTVVGTVFSVDRTGLGTVVEVSRGRVKVACVDGSDHEVGSGDQVTCWPGDVAGLLGRARTLRAQGGSPQTVLATLDRALALEGPALARGEALAMQLRLRLASGDRDGAVLSARRYLDEGHQPREAEVRALLDDLEGP